MELNVSVSLQVLKGVGWLEFPEALKREPLQSQIHCSSLYFLSNTEAKGEPLFVVCSGSLYYTHNHEMKNNILAMFQHRPTSHLLSIAYPAVPITMSQDKLAIEIVNYHGLRQNVSCLGVFQIQGKVANKLLAI